ncbi:MAG TPA: GNAT family N-acetyltransferase [Actinomycetota bacterium]|nr:GNAT family N-acetyltransferase [Actinomycetota bacterium]
MRFHPPQELRGELVRLRTYRPSDLDEMKASITASHEHLRGWMPWAATPPTDGSVLEFLTPSIEAFGGTKAANYAITLAEDGTYVGGCGLMPRIGEGALEIGYWVDARHTGRGIATESARLLTEAALGLNGVDQVEIHCDEANVRSAAIPRRLGYRLDRIEPDQVKAPLETGRSMIWVAERDRWPVSG